MKKYITKLKEEKGFTLIEMLIVIMIVSLLLLMVVSNVGGVEDSVTKTTDAGIVQTVESQKLIYKMDKKKQGSLEELVTDQYITAEQKQIYEKIKGK